MLRFRQSGDTIIEVMVVLAVLGLAIGVSYATANRSLLNARQAQENSQATELVQAQTEQLRTQMSNNDSSSSDYIYKPGVYFCMSGNSVVPEPSLNVSNPATLTNYGNYPAACVNSFYHLSVTYSATDDKFTVRALWDDVLGQGSDTVTNTYRLHYIANLSPTGHVDVVCWNGSIVQSQSDCPPPPPPPPSITLSVSGGSGPGGAFYPNDTVSVTVTISGGSAGDTCVIKGSAGNTYLNSCSGTFSAAALPLNSREDITAYVTDKGTAYPSNTVTVNTTLAACPAGFFQGTPALYAQESPSYASYGYTNVPLYCVPVSL